MFDENVLLHSFGLRIWILAGDGFLRFHIPCLFDFGLDGTSEVSFGEFDC